MESKIFILSMLALAAFTQVSRASNCGGSLQSDQGSLEYADDDNDMDGRTCVWAFRLQSREGFSIHLDSIGGDGNTTLGIFSSEQAGSTFPILTPRYIFNESTLDLTVTPLGDIMIIVLNPSTYGGRQFAISWKAIGGPADPSVESANYLDSDDGRITQNDAGVWLLAYIVNPPSGSNLNVEAKIVGFEEDCAEVAFTIFEVLPVGNLREVARTCGRPVTLQNLSPPIISFVAKASLSQSETISLKWSAVESLQ